MTLFRTSLLCCCATFSILFQLAAGMAFDSDLFWHISAGQATLSSGSVLAADSFSYTAQGSSWTNHSWASQVVLAGLTNAFDIAGPQWFLGGLAALGYTVLFLCCSGARLLRLLVCTATALVAVSVWVTRPYVVTVAFLCIFVGILELDRHARTRLLWLLPPAMLIWSNAHGGYVMGFAFLGLELAGSVLDKNDSHQAATRWRRLAAVTMCCAAVLPVHPLGWGVLTTTLHTVGQEALPYIVEWKAPSFRTREEFAFLMTLLVVIGALAKSSTPVTWREVLCTALFLAGALLARRNISLFGIVSAPILCRHTATAAAFLHRRTRPSLAEHCRKHASLGWLALALAGVVILCWRRGPLSQMTLETMANHACGPIVSAVQKKPRAGAIFNSYNIGACLIWRGSGNLRVFIDSRADLYPDELFREYMSIIRADPGWRQKLYRRNVAWVAVEPSSALGRVIAEDSEWRTDWRGPGTTLYKRRSSPRPPGRSARELPK